MCTMTQTRTKKKPRPITQIPSCRPCFSLFFYWCRREDFLFLIVYGFMGAARLSLSCSVEAVEYYWWYAWVYKRKVMACRNRDRKSIQFSWFNFFDFEGIRALCILYESRGVRFLFLCCFLLVGIEGYRLLLANWLDCRYLKCVLQSLCFIGCLLGRL